MGVILTTAAEVRGALRAGRSVYAKDTNGQPYKITRIIQRRKTKKLELKTVSECWIKDAKEIWYE